MWAKTNINYLVFLFLSIVTSLTLYWNKNKKSKLILAAVVLINFLYIIFSFGISNIGLNNTQGLFVIWFLILSLISNYIKNWFGYIIMTLSFVWIILTIWLATIPLYENWPDIKWFEAQFSPKLIIYSKANINQEKATIQIDKKEYNILNGLLSHELKINNSGSQILFKSDKKHLNTFGYLLFSNQEIIQIYPQSALNINKQHEIQIITWTIKHHPENTQTQYTFTWKYTSFGIINPENTKEIINFYQNKQTNYILDQIWWDFWNNKRTINTSKFILNMLSTILPWQFNDNLNNFNNFQKYININTTNQEVIFDDKNINQDIIKEITESLGFTQIIK